MDNNENLQISGRQLFYSILVFVFIWGSLWVGTNGVSIARNSNKTGFQSANISSTNSVSVFVNSIKPKPVITPESSLTIMIGGDIMLDRGVRLTGNKYGYDTLFASITPLFKQADIVVANLEGPITSKPSKTLLPNGKTTKDLIFTFSSKTAKVLADAGITLVSLANNHMDNFGLAGIVETKKWLTEAGVSWFGDYKNSSSTEAIISKNNINVAFVGYHAFQKGFEGVLQSVQSLKEQGNFVIVMPHWGEEYATTSSALVKSQARALVLAGANAVIGSHPHVIQEKVWMGDVPVIYSLGNLLFDQHFSPEVMKGNVAELKLIKLGNVVKIDKVRIYETSIASKRGIQVNTEPVDF